MTINQFLIDLDDLWDGQLMADALDHLNNLNYPDAPFTATAFGRGVRRSERWMKERESRGPNRGRWLLVLRPELAPG